MKLSAAGAMKSGVMHHCELMAKAPSVVVVTQADPLLLEAHDLFVGQAKLEAVQRSQW